MESGNNTKDIRKKIISLMKHRRLKKMRLGKFRATYGVMYSPPRKKKSHLKLVKLNETIE